MTRREITFRVVFAVLCAGALLYAADFLVLRFSNFAPTVSQPFESLIRTRILAIPQKSGKFDYQIDQLQAGRDHHLCACDFSALRQSTVLVRQATHQPAHSGQLSRLHFFGFLMVSAGGGSCL